MFPIEVGTNIRAERKFEPMRGERAKQEVKRIIATSEFRALGSPPERVKYLVSKEISYSAIASGLGLKLSTAKRWGSMQHVRPSRGRPSLLSDSQKEEITSKIVKSANECTPLTSSGVRDLASPLHHFSST